jgi:uncharacterized repeat protein (TIGR01451 family)
MSVVEGKMLRLLRAVALGTFCIAISFSSDLNLDLSEAALPRKQAASQQRQQSSDLPIPTTLPASAANASGIAGGLPLSFVANNGQADSQFDYISSLPGASLSLEPTGVTLALSIPVPRQRPVVPASAQSARTGSNAIELGTVSGSRQLSLTLVGGSSQSKAKPLDDLGTKVSYFLGSNPASWIRDAPSSTAVEYDEVYPGVSIKYHGNSRALAYEFEISPGSDPRGIRVAFGGIDALQLEANGDLRIAIPQGQLRQSRPVAYQETNGDRKLVEIGYELANDKEFRFRLGSFNPKLPLTIDPVLTFSNVFGSVAADSGNALARDTAGFLYVAGEISRVSVNKAVQQAFVAKFDPSGSMVSLSMFGDPNDNSAANGVAVDVSGNVYAVGTTKALGFPTTPNAFRQHCTFNGGCGQDAFLLKMDATGSLVYSTFFGGILDETGNAIAVDNFGGVYITGLTVGDTLDSRAGITIKGGFQRQITATTCGPPGAVVGTDAYVAKFDLTQAGANSLVYSSPLGGGGDDEGTGIAVFGNEAYVAGVTGTTLNSTFFCTASLGPKFPTSPNAFAPDGGLLPSAFLTVVNSNGDGVLYSTVLPGAEVGRAAAVDGSGAAYLTGSSIAGFQVTPNAAQGTFGGGSTNAFVAKINPLASGQASLVYATFVGGNIEDVGEAIAVDSSGRASITGRTRSPNFPVTSTAFQKNIAGGLCGTQNEPCPDAFITRVSSDGTAFTFSTYLGGTSFDEGLGIAVGPATWFVTGRTFSSDFPTTLGQHNGDFDVFVASILSGADLSLTMTGTPPGVRTGQLITYTITVTNGGPDRSPREVLVDVPQVGTQQFFSSNVNCTPTGVAVSCDLAGLDSGSSTTAILSFIALRPGALQNDVSVSGPLDDPNLQNNSATVITRAKAVADIAVAVAQTPINPVGVGTQGTYTISISNNGPDLASGVHLQQTISAGIRVVSVSISQGTCGVITGGVGCQIGFLNGATLPGLPGVPRAVPVTVVFTPTRPGSFIVHTTVGSAVPDPIPANNVSWITTMAAQAPLPHLTARFGLPRLLNRNSALVSETFVNNGPGNAVNVVLQQTTIRITTGSGSVRILSPQLPVRLGNIPSGASHVVNFVVEFSGVVGGGSISQTGTMQDNHGDVIPFSISTGTGPIP